MKNKLLIIVLFVTSIFATSIVGCRDSKNNFDASGTFETDEVIVSSELAGKLLTFDVEEGRAIAKDSVVGTLDANQIIYQKEQVEESISALSDRTSDVLPQINMLNQQLAVQQSQLKNLLHEQKRVENLVKQDAATGKQLDDINASIEIMKGQMLVTQRQITVQRTGTSTQNRGVMSESKPLQKRIAQLDDQLLKAKILNPLTGVVIAKYAEAGEVTAAGKALYKIADLNTMYLRAYITGIQLPEVKMGQQVRVFLDSGENKYREVPGMITWIADKAEFTPKTIQTKEERANLVYAMKVKVKNDGFIKIGMYGEVKLH
ncbi:HlyD family secretion protein [Flavitalea sp.]|nr:HlyD family efflux transporter periplasmic adaptor subunit [Flavitalea sp.]